MTLMIILMKKGLIISNQNDNINIISFYILNYEIIEICDNIFSTNVLIYKNIDVIFMLLTVLVKRQIY